MHFHLSVFAFVACFWCHIQEIFAIANFPVSTSDITILGLQIGSFKKLFIFLSKDSAVFLPSFFFHF
jgi:hypothetical protein